MQSVIHRKRRREPLEDQITAFTLGPLRYLVPTDVVSILWGCLAEIPLEKRSEPVKSVEFFFWPRKFLDRRLEDPETKAHVEPDLVVKMTTTTGRISVLVVEDKWNAGMSSIGPVSGIEDQCERQMRAVQGAVRHSAPNREKIDLMHILLSKHPMGLSSATGVRVKTTWLAFLDRLKIRKSELGREASEWVQDFSETLETLGLHSFDGFRYIDNLRMVQMKPFEVLIFDRIPYFSWLSTIANLKAGMERKHLFFDATDPSVIKKGGSE